MCVGVICNLSKELKDEKEKTLGISEESVSDRGKNVVRVCSVCSRNSQKDSMWLGQSGGRKAGEQVRGYGRIEHARLQALEGLWLLARRWKVLRAVT